MDPCPLKHRLRVITWLWKLARGISQHKWQRLWEAGEGL